MSQRVKLNLNLIVHQLATSPAGGAPNAQLDVLLDYLDGAGDGQSQVCHFGESEIAAAGSDVLNLSDGSLKQPNGEDAVFTEVTHQFYWLLSTTAGDELSVGPDATNGFGAGTGGFWADASDRNFVGASIDVLRDPGLAILARPRGVDVTAASADEIFVGNAGATAVKYRRILIGR